MKQREIKFRAWDGKQMHHFDLWWNHADYLNPEEVTVMQFTGLRDKNGVEIYEGDILCSKTWGNNERTKNKYHVVEWGRCGWVASGYNGAINVKPSLDVRSDFEVIGTIHQTPLT